MGDERLVWTVPPGGADRLDRALARAFPEHSRARVQAWIAEGRVTVDGAAERPSTKLRPGQVVEVSVPPVVVGRIEPEDLGVPILFEDADLVVVVKPAGMAVHPSAGHPGGTLVNTLLAQVSGLSGIGGEERPGIVHRLDLGTSGVMVAAKNDLTHRALSALFAVHDIERRYLALVHRVPLHDAGRFESVLARDPQHRMRFASLPPEQAPDDEPRVLIDRWGDGGEPEEEDEEELALEARRARGRRAATRWRVLARGDRLALVECTLETGRTHQVRVHLSEAGHPIVGDNLYNRRDCVAPAALRTAAEALTHPLLHAWVLGFVHPRTGEALRFVAPPPADFLDFAAKAGLPVPSAP